MFPFVDTCIIRLNDECECVRPQFGWDNKYTNPAEGAERGISAMEGRLYIRFLYKVAVRICCALLKMCSIQEMMPVYLDLQLELKLEPVPGWSCLLPGCLPVAVGTTHTHTDI